MEVCQALHILKLMLLSRMSDKREAMLVRQGKAHFHMSCSGHEALIALSTQLNPDDFLYPYYRGHHLMMGKGLKREVLARDFLAKTTSSSGGRNMPIHAGSKELNIFPSIAPTGSHCLPAVGNAWGQKLDGLDQLTVCSIGEGAMREGEFYEAVCFAVEKKLPILFAVEDNKYAISTPTKEFMPFRLGVFDKNLWEEVDGSNVLEVYSSSKKAIADIRDGKGPGILWFTLDRLDPHTAVDDHRQYRRPDELECMKDPIKILAEHLMAEGVLTEEDFKNLEKLAQNEAEQIYSLAEQDLEPSITEIQSHLYASPVVYETHPSSLGNQEMTMVEAINNALDSILSNNKKAIMLGEDIEDPKGGVFGFTKGLSTLYQNQVFNAPIAEATIIGSAVGLAARGFRPVFEIQFTDFIAPGFNQLVSQVSTLRWRTCGSWSCPMILYAPYGAYLPGGGIWHSQSNEGWWTHIPGIRVAIPSNAEDVFRLFMSACQDNDPSLILIPKHMARVKSHIKSSDPLPFGKANVKQEGTDVTIVTWGNCVELCEQAIITTRTNNISVELIDLRTLVPCDWNCIEKSLSKTGRLIVVHEDSKTSGFGASIITEMLADKDRFGYLYTSPILVAREDVHIPYNATLEYAILPSVDQISKAILEVTES